ncbi:cytochrome P450 [Streptomyces griseochromogenes]|uniref:Cytochrome n=1 Tax=Streptomyces griseochromogenes TaxID=68214 RepID=A0A1B1AU13_9ACTN|nr:cytochrome P450 [Streptomyces griseochromogenes]ANP50010.1 cytochrome [Streptomyces griseochromogenes]MBP2048386.1 cytochrome P450 [Streptomyces griseochromogenes]
MVEETPWQQALRYANRANPYPFYEELRRTPVARQPDGTYVVSTYQEIVALLHDPRVSSDVRKLPVPVAAPAEGSAEAEPITEAVISLEPNIITQDPPEHDRDRRMMTPRFVGPPHSPHLISDLEPEIRRIVDGLLDNMQGKTRFDAVDEFAYPLPVTVICKVLGVPLEDEPRFHSWIETALDALDFGPEAASEEMQSRLAGGRRAVQEFGQFAADLLDRYARQPGPGMLSAMVNEDGPEERMSQGVLASNALLLIFAGHETTVNLIAHSVLTLLRHPDALEKLRRRPELIVPGVEELLRFESSVQFWHTRSAVEDIDIAGTTIPKGAPIFLAYGSANRDPQRFTDPDELDLERCDNQHLGFSQGIHFCFGAPLARLEVQVAVGEFVRRVQNPRLVEDPPPYRHNQIFRGPRHVLVDIDGIHD